MTMLVAYDSQSKDSLALRKAIKQILDTHLHLPDASAGSFSPFGLAVSGGPDSAMLAVEVAILARQYGFEAHLFHVHHGLQEDADSWRDHVHTLAGLLSLPCHSIQVRVESGTGKGIEAAAREVRYKALTYLAHKVRVKHILLAHHQDDQAETVLLRLLRGSGPGGLAAMTTKSERNGLIFLRPWLMAPRIQILQQMQVFFMATGWQAVYDTSNHDDRYTRSALRERLTTALNQRWPGWQQRLAQHARQAAEAQDILNSVAWDDLQTLEPCDDNSSFSLALWRKLPASRQAQVLRYWLSLHQLTAPTQARLQELMRQLRTVHALGHDRHLKIRHAKALIFCKKGRVGISLQPEHATSHTNPDETR